MDEPIPKPDNSPMMAEAGLSPKDFGRGHTIGFFIWFALIACSFINLFRLEDQPVPKARAVGLLVMSFGGAFAWAISYHLVTRKGFPIGGMNGNRRIIHWSKNPIGYWMFAIAMLLLFATIIGRGVWLWAHPDMIGPARAEHRRGMTHSVD